MTTYTFETASPGWTGQTNNFSVLTAHNTASTICSQQGYFNNSPVLFGGTYYNESVIQSDAAIDADSITVYFNAQNGTYGGGYLNQVTIKYASSPSGPWIGGGSFTFGSVTNFGADGCQSLTFTPGSGVTGQYFRIYVNVNGATAAVASYIYKVEVTAATGTLLLDLAADFDNLYATKLDSGTLTLLSYDHATLTESTVDTFGTCSDTDIANGTNALNVTVIPGAIYLWGYDGNGVQVQRSTNGGSTWDDLSGSWSTAVVTAFEVDVFNAADIVVTLSNDDIYRTVDGGITWTKTGDGPGADVVAAERHPIVPTALMVASSSSGDIDVTPDLGGNFTAGTISSGAGLVTVIKKAL